MKLLMSILLFSYFGCAQTAGTHVPVVKKINNSNGLPGHNEVRPKMSQQASLDDVFVKAVNQQIATIKSTCDGEKTLDQKIINVRDGVSDLRKLIEQYLPQQNKLSMNNTILLLELDDVFSYGMVFRGKITRQMVTSENLTYSFIVYYKFIHNLGDKVKVQDFAQQWPKDVVQGLSCLYPKTER